MAYYKKIESVDSLNKNVILGVTAESNTLEFKREINFRKPNIHEEFALDIAQFANIYGGSILIGVDEVYCSNLNKKVASKFIDSDFEEISKFIYDKVLQYLYPNYIDLSVDSIMINDSTTIVAINVNPVVRGLVCYCSKNPPFLMKFPYRTSYGKKYYTPQEVEKRMSNPYRYIELKILKIFEDFKSVKIYPDLIVKNKDSSVKWDIKEYNYLIKSVGESEYTLSLAGIDVNIPFSLTKDVWVTEDDKIGLLLNVKLVLSSNRKFVSFDLS